MQCCCAGAAAIESRAISLLLKDLGKGGESDRPTELFDALRALEREHPRNPANPRT